MKSAFEKRYGRPMVGSLKPQPISKECTLCKIAKVPVTFILFMLRIFILGPHPHNYIRWVANINPETLASGFAMTLSSIFAFLNLGDLGKFLNESDYFGEFTGIMKGIIILFLIIQFIRGLAFLGGTDIIPIQGTIGNTIKFHDGIYRGDQFGPDIKGAFKSSRKSNIQEFRDYVDSKISLKSNAQKEKYFRDFSGGGKD